MVFLINPYSGTGLIFFLSALFFADPSFLFPLPYEVFFIACFSCFPPHQGMPLKIFLLAPWETLPCLFLYSLFFFLIKV